jgi:hypothetical protein
MKYKILKLDEFVGKELGEVKNYLDKNYAGKLATEEDLKNLPDECKDGNWYYTFGSLVRNSDGHWCLPYTSWFGSEWCSGSGLLWYGWLRDFRVVLLDIENCDSDESLTPLNSDSLNIELQNIVAREIANACIKGENTSRLTRIYNKLLTIPLGK